MGKVLTLEQVQQQLPFHLQTLQRWCAKGILPASKVQGIYLVEEEDIKKLLERKKVKVK